jgi:glutamate formiminotransferase
MQPLVECIPNFSEGRRLEVIDALAGALQAHESVRLLELEFMKEFVGKLWKEMD